VEEEVHGAQGDITGADRREQKRKRVAAALVTVLNLAGTLAPGQLLAAGLVTDVAAHALKHIIGPLQNEKRQLRARVRDLEAELAMTNTVLARLESERPAPPVIHEAPGETGISGVGDAGD
jgi:hypothetical protein